MSCFFRKHNAADAIRPFGIVLRHMFRLSFCFFFFLGGGGVGGGEGGGGFASLTSKKETSKFSSANFQKMLSPIYIILRIQRPEDKQCRSR